MAVAAYNSGIDANNSKADFPELKPLTNPFGNLTEVYVVEIWCTFVFVMINLIVKNDSQSPTNIDLLKVLMVALSLYAQIGVAANITGAAINPTVGLVLSSYHSPNFGTTIAYILAPAIGGTLAGFFNMLHLEAQCQMGHDVKPKNKAQVANETEGRYSALTQ